LFFIARLSIHAHLSSSHVVGCTLGTPAKVITLLPAAGHAILLFKAKDQRARSIAPSTPTLATAAMCEILTLGVPLPQ
jgi:hypothetical protein